MASRGEEKPMTTYTSEISFVDSLVQTHLTPILEASIPTNPFSTGEIDIEEWIATFEKKLCRIAWSLCQQLYTVNSIAPDDLMQEARIAVWQMTKRYNSSMGLGGFRHATLKRARGAMLDYISKMNRTPAQSLHEFLEFDESPDEEREIAAPPTSSRKTSLSMRRYVLAAIRRAKLTKQEHLAIMAYFAIDNANGHCSMPDDVMRRLRMSRTALANAKLRALKKLREHTTPRHMSRQQKRKLAMQSTNIRKIKAAIQDQAYRGRRTVLIDAGRVIDVRTVKGVLQAKTLGGKWYSVESVTVN
jgi:RNA polymerase sigma factor (sigma-70 family)